MKTLGIIFFSLLLISCASSSQKDPVGKSFENFRQTHMSTILKFSQPCAVAVKTSSIEKYARAFPQWTAKEVGNQLWGANDQYVAGCGGTIYSSAVKDCESWTSEDCIIGFYQTVNDDTANIHTQNILTVMDTYKSNELLRQRLSKEKEQKLKNEAEQIEIDKYTKTCKNFGFDDGSKDMSACVFDLYKQQRSATQAQTINQPNINDSSGVRALLEEQKKQRQLEAALELMKQGSEMMNPPKPKLTCKYSPLTYKTVCN